VIASVTHRGALDMQVCVPAEWSDEAVVAFANSENPSGTEGGWHIRRAGDPLLKGQPERNPCGGFEGFVHLMLDC